MNAPSSDPRGRGFLIAVFVAAAAVGVLVAYLGITGRIGTPIP